MRRKLRWGIIGTGQIAAEFATALVASEECDVVNVVGSTPAKGQAFAGRFELPSYSSSVERMVAVAGVEAVYVASPNSMHEEHVIACLRAGKHVLCEKPLAPEASGVERMLTEAKASGTFLMEGYMYRCHPIISQLLECLSSGTIGAVRHLRSEFGFRHPRSPEHRLYKAELGGGGILDVGGYPMSFARLLAGISAGKPFAEPVRLHGVGTIGPTGVDERASCLLQFASGFTAELACAIAQPLGTTTVITGDSGTITLPNLWICGGERQGLENSFTVQPYGGKPSVVTATATKSVFALEAEQVLASASQQQARWPLMSWEDSLNNAHALDAWRAQLSLGDARNRST
jgi:predicted dehydrogenase